MNFADQFIPTAASVGLLAAITNYALFVSVFGFAGTFVWALANRDRIAPEHRDSIVLSAVIVGVAGVSYFFIHQFYHSMLVELANTPDAPARQTLVRDSFLAIGQFRYVDWFITTPLLLLKTVMTLRIKPKNIKGALFLLLFADLFMIVTGYIGEQQFTAGGTYLQGRLFFWGLISTIGYIFIPIILFSLYRRYSADAKPEERTAYKWLAFATITTWGVYPIGYMLPALAPGLSLNWVHIAFTVADMINKIGAAVVLYIAAAKIGERMVPEESVVEKRQMA